MIKEMEIQVHQSEKTIGKIVKLSPNGWGFILSPSYQFTRIFFHWTALNPTIHFNELKVGMIVKFYLQRYKERGVCAYKIEVVESNSPNENKEGEHHENRIEGS